MIYLDNSATTMPSEAARQAALNMMTDGFGNPSTLYRLGLNAEKVLKAARRSVAKSVGASENEISFTSGGTESDNTAIFGAYESRKKQGIRVITTAVEHPAVLRCFETLKRRGADVVILPVLNNGNFDIDSLKAALNEQTILVSVMHVNNETGAIFPIVKISQILSDFAKKHGMEKPLLHSDCVQSFGKIPVNVKSMGVDLASFSAHKIHGLKGSGALYVKNGIHIPPYLYGGGQEKGFRSGTENMPGIAAFGAAAQTLAPADPAAALYLKKRILEEIPDVKVNSPDDACPLILNMSFTGCRAEVLLHSLEQDEIYISTGSACSSKDRGSHVLSAMRLSPEEIEGAVRFSFSSENTVAQMDIVVDKLRSYVESQRMLRKAFRRR